MSIQPHLRVGLFAAAIAVVAASFIAAGLEWRRADERKALAAARALGSTCERWPALQRLGALEDELADAGVKGLSEDEQRRLARTLGSLSAACPEPRALVSPAATYKVLASRCPEEGWKPAPCTKALAGVFAREKALRGWAGQVLLADDEAWRTGPFANDLVAALSGRDRGRAEGLVPDAEDAGSAALETFLGTARIRQLAAAYVARSWADALRTWARGGRGAWQEALFDALGPDAGANLPRVRDTGDHGVGQLVSVSRDRCEMVDRPGAAKARVEVRPCAGLVMDAPKVMALPDGEGRQELFDVRGRAFAATGERPSFSFSPAGVLVNGDAAEWVRADAPALFAADTRPVPKWMADTMKGLIESLPLGAGEGLTPAVVTSVDEWSSPWLPFRLKVAWLSPFGVAVAPAGSGEWLVLGGMDYQAKLADGEECAGTAPRGLSTIQVTARGVVPGEGGFFFLAGTFSEDFADCDGSRSDSGQFVLTCSASGCSQVRRSLNPARGL